MSPSRHFRARALCGVAAVFCIAVASRSANAAGFDTPILYTARHQAMGGTGIASVDDASAGFHNPAGLQGVHGLGLIGDFSLILGKVRSTPTAYTGNLSSNTVKAPFFLLGAAYRVHPWLTLGLAGFPVASGGAEYRYAVDDVPNLNSTEIVFFETTPMLSLNVPTDRWLPGKLAFGAGYRFSYVTFDREQGAVDNPDVLNLKLKGSNWTGFRIGAQYQPLEPLKLGVVFRNKVTVTTKADSATVFGLPATNGSLDFVLPAKLGFGARVDVGHVGLATDVEYAFQSQNKAYPLAGTVTGTRLEAPNVFNWQNGVTWRAGAEYRLGHRPMIPLRVGYIFDSRVTNPIYPSAFGTPPAATRTFTAGTGYVEQHWQVNVAVSRRFGSTAVIQTDPDTCAFCSYPGNYSITMTGLYVDASVDLGP